MIAEICKRFLALLVMVALIVLSTAAGTEQALPGYLSAGSVARYIVENGCGRDAADLERVDQTRDEDTLAFYLTQVYGLEPDSWTGCAVYRAGGTEAFEIAVIRLADEKQAKAAADRLEGYIEAREGDFAGYEPEQADIVHGSAAVWSRYGDAALLICEDPDGAEESFSASYEALMRCPFDPPQTEDMTLYDSAPVLAAWTSGDDSDLEEHDRAIFEAASAVLAEVTAEDMSQLELEKAVYGWITEHVRYDQDHYDPLATMDPDSYDPAGPLEKGKAVCVGYATAFQLLMDMTGVECITVVGASRQNAADHAWNMVRLDGRWYCVDATWDEGSPPDEWDYFNVTSDAMAASNHQWDYDAVPEAVTDGSGEA